MTRFEFGPEGGVVRIASRSMKNASSTTSGKHDAQAITVCSAELSGQRVLRALHRQHGPDLPPLLVDWFSSAPAVSQEQAEQIAKAFRYWIEWRQCHCWIQVIADVLEHSGCEASAANSECNVTRTDGRVRTLGALLKDLSPQLDPA